MEPVTIVHLIIIMLLMLVIVYILRQSDKEEARHVEEIYETKKEYENIISVEFSARKEKQEQIEKLEEEYNSLEKNYIKLVEEISNIKSLSDDMSLVFERYKKDYEVVSTIRYAYATFDAGLAVYFTEKPMPQAPEYFKEKFKDNFNPYQLYPVAVNRLPEMVSLISSNIQIRQDVTMFDGAIDVSIGTLPDEIKKRLL